MQLHHSLSRQLNKYVGDVEAQPASIKALLQVVSEAYDHFDADRQLMERSLEKTSREMGEIVSQLRTTLDSTTDGILVVDGKGKMSLYNKQFEDMWHIPSQTLVTRNDGEAVAFVQNQLVNPQQFVDKVQELYDNPQAESFDTLEFKDGRVFERYSRPQKVGDKVLGRVWSFRDVTQRRQAEQVIKEKVTELERMNKLMVDRELKMVELKNRIRELEAKPAAGTKNGAGGGSGPS